MPGASDDVIARRRRRAEDTRRWRSRQRRGVQLFSLECGPAEYDFGLRESQVANKAAVKAALARALRKAVIVLLHEGDRRAINLCDQVTLSAAGQCYIPDHDEETKSNLSAAAKHRRSRDR